MPFAHVGAPQADDVARQSWAPLARGALGVLFGLYATFWPALTLIGLSLSWGAYAVLRGLAGVHHGVVGRWWTLIAASVPMLVAGLFVLTAPDIDADPLRRFVAAVAITTGVMDVLAALDLRRSLDAETTLPLMGAAAITVGVLLLTTPTYGVIAVAWLIGAGALVDAVLSFGLFSTLQRNRRRARRVAARALGAYHMPHQQRPTLTEVAGRHDASA